MPTYEYRCKECGHRFEAFQMISDPPLEHCPLCSGEVEKLISAGAGLLFKGNGFYVTDYRGSDYKKSAESESKSGSSDKSGDKAKTPKARSKMD